MINRLSIASTRAALLLAAAACSAPGDSPAAPAGSTGAGAGAGLARLDEALRMRGDHSLWEQVAPLADEASARLLPAARAGDRSAAAGLAAAQALSTWQAVCEAGWTLEGEESTPAMKEAWKSARDATANSLVCWLQDAGDGAAAGFTVRASIQLESGRDAEFETALGEGLKRFPADMALNDLARAQRDHLGDPGALALLLAHGAADSPHADQAEAGPTESITTQGYLLLAAGLKAEEAGDAPTAIDRYESAGRLLASAGSARGQRVSEWTLRLRLADCYANAGRLRLAAAQAALAKDGLAAAAPSLQAAEADWTEALIAQPDDEECRAGAAATADAWFAGGDMAGARDAFGRLARRFDVAEWWNNTAFLARETGQYEESYAAYEHCLQLEPDNARFVNDTALILLYHLHRDLPRAEQMFRRAIELGRAACDNPFADDAVREQNFLAYTDAMLNLALLMAQAGRLDEAAKQCDELLAIAPERPDAQDLRDKIAAARSGKATTETDDSLPAAPRIPGP